MRTLHRFVVSFLAFSSVSSHDMQKRQALNVQNPPVWQALDVLRGSVAPNAAEVQALMASAVPGRSYPTLSFIPQTGFSCSTVRQPGFYADPDTGCQVFRRCEANNYMFSYICPNTTIFNQITLVCDHWYNVNCQQSSAFVDYSNPRIYNQNALLLDDVNIGGASGTGSFGGGGSSGSGGSAGSGNFGGGGSSIGGNFGGGGSSGSGNFGGGGPSIGGNFGSGGLSGSGGFNLGGGGPASGGFTQGGGGGNSIRYSGGEQFGLSGGQGGNGGFNSFGGSGGQNSASFSGGNGGGSIFSGGSGQNSGLSNSGYQSSSGGSFPINQGFSAGLTGSGQPSTFRRGPASGYGSSQQSNSGSSGNLMTSFGGQTSYSPGSPQQQLPFGTQINSPPRPIQPSSPQYQTTGQQQQQQVFQQPQPQFQPAGYAAQQMQQPQPSFAVQTGPSGSSYRSLSNKLLRLQADASERVSDIVTSPSPPLTVPTSAAESDGL